MEEGCVSVVISNQSALLYTTPALIHKRSSAAVSGQYSTPMACLIAFSFSTNLFYPKTSFQGTNIRKLASGKFVCPAARRTGKLILSNHASGDILSLNRSCHRDIFAPTRRFCEPVMCHFVASFSAHMLISGFWMGPDIEDGWGFVEAFVHRMY
ncbi:Uncharacterized protein Adt_27552 [Abeliophyllum distichum]|uniref:Uncharacterized protein n=1 Tax=Abeliophyllum distichum TaxID=126358 RepID=A0ABD1RV79_9LAMI